jgi:hypothetical protein
MDVTKLAAEISEALLKHRDMCEGDGKSGVAAADNDTFLLTALSTDALLHFAKCEATYGNRYGSQQSFYLGFMLGMHVLRSISEKREADAQAERQNLHEAIHAGDDEEECK